MKKMPRFKVSVGFDCVNINTNYHTQGASQAKIMTFEDLTYLLAAIDPFNCDKFINNVKRLSRKDSTTIKSDFATDDIKGYRIIKIERN